MRLAGRTAIITGGASGIGFAFAQRFVAGKGGGQEFMGRRLNEGETFFVDAYDQEYNRDIEPMQPYAQFHSEAPKTFLGTTCPGGTMPRASLACALDVLFTHPNVGPFIGRQLIQRLVTSNPSPAYVARVARAFADNGQGVRGAVVGRPHDPAPPVVRRA